MNGVVWATRSLILACVAMFLLFAVHPFVSVGIQNVLLWIIALLMVGWLFCLCKS